MKFYYKIFLPCLLIIVFSCGTKKKNQSQTETVLGIKLGEPFEEQVDSLIEEGKIQVTNEGIKFIEYTEYKGALTFYPFSDNKTLQSIKILFVNPENKGKLEGSEARNGVLSEENKNSIIKSYEAKYGSTKPTKNNEYDWVVYKWIKSNLHITLGYRELGTDEFRSYYLVTAEYMLEKQAQKEIEERINKSNPNI